MTGGYDRKIVIYNYQHGHIVEEMKTNNSPIACMSLTSDGNRVVSTGLDCSVSVWRVLRNVIFLLMLGNETCDAGNRKHVH